MSTSAVISNGSKYVVKSALPKSATEPKTSACPTTPSCDVADVVEPRVAVVMRLTAKTRKPSAINSAKTAGIPMRGSLSCSAENGATPLESSAMTNRKRIKIAPEYTINWMTARNSALSVRYIAASAPKCSNSATTLYTGRVDVTHQIAEPSMTTASIQK